MSSETRYFRVEGKVFLDRDDVIAWLNEDLGLDEDEGLDEDYQPTDDEWMACALELFENDEICWIESDLIPDK